MTGEPEESSRDAERQQDARQVQQYIDDVVAADLETADGVVEGERPIRKGAAGNALAAARRVEGQPRRPQLLNRGVLVNRREVVEQENACPVNSRT